MGSGSLPRLLIVEPDPEIRASLAAYLGTWFDVQQAEGAKQAVSALGGGGVDLLLAEVEIQDAYGPGFLSEVRARWPQTTIAVLYYYSHKTQGLQPIIDRLGDVCIQKPFDLEKVGATLLGLVGRGGKRGRT